MHTNQDLGRIQERGGAIALGSAIDYLENVQMHNVYERDKALVGLCPEKMNKINNIEIYGGSMQKTGCR